MSTTVKRAETLHPAETEKARTGITSFIRWHPLPIFYALAFVISWGGIVLILGPDGLFSTAATMPLAGGVALLAGPSIAGVLLTGSSMAGRAFAGSYLDCGDGGSALAGTRWRC
jgi:hypothetical protein